MGPLIKKKKLKAEARNRKYYISRSGGMSRKVTKRSIGDTLLMTNQSFAPLEEQEYPSKNTSGPRDHGGISRTHEVSVAVENV
jgi:hypothetical protein